jgi:alanyl-tRNA synthetase
VADTGTIVSAEGASLAVESVQKYGAYVLHIGKMTVGTLKLGEEISLQVDYARRALIAKNHTATHMLNLAIKGALGMACDQRGSLCDADKYRFDFAYGKPLTMDELLATQQHVNEQIAAALPVQIQVTGLEGAKTIRGLRAVFGEQYPDPVRVVSIGATVPDLLADPSNARWRECSVEFCGGTHTRSSEEVQHFAILSEGASSAGIRRIFAVTGTAAHAAAATAANLEQRLAAARKLEGEALTEEVTAIASALTELPVSVVFRHRVEPAVVELREKAKEWRKAQEGANREVVVAQAREIADRHAKSAAPAKPLVAMINGADAPALLAAIDCARAKLGDTPILFLSPDFDGGKVAIAATSPKPAIDKGLKAGDWAKACRPR